MEYFSFSSFNYTFTFQFIWSSPPLLPLFPPCTCSCHVEHSMIIGIIPHKCIYLYSSLFIYLYIILWPICLVSSFLSFLVFVFFSMVVPFAVAICVCWFICGSLAVHCTMSADLSVPPLCSFKFSLLYTETSVSMVFAAAVHSRMHHFRGSPWSDISRSTLDLSHVWMRQRCWSNTPGFGGLCVPRDPGLAFFFF